MGQCADYKIDALSIGPFAPPFACLLAPLTHSLAPHCSLRSRAPLRSFVRSLAHSLTPALMGKWFFFLHNERVDFISFEPSVEPSSEKIME